MTDPRKHWEAIYGSKTPREVSWYAPHLEVSLALVDALELSSGARIIDVGGGASTFVDDLLARGFRQVTVLDVSGRALAVARERLGARAETVGWLETDLFAAELPASGFELWHDRAVFHFLTREEDRLRYAERARRAVVPGGYVILGGFGPGGPQRCSGLDVHRLCAPQVCREFGNGFELAETRSHLHRTPWGAEQEFLYCLLRRC